MKRFFLANALSTRQLGEKIGRLAPSPSLLCLYGGLGLGKTCLVQGIARGLEIHDLVQSPSFVICANYKGRQRLHHIDAYRLRSISEFLDIGGREWLDDDQAFCVIEWCENIKELFPTNTARATFSLANPDDPDGGRYLDFFWPTLEEVVA